MRRHLLNLLTALSLLLCVAVCALWARSYRTRDSLLFGHRPDRRHSVISMYGRLTFQRLDRARGGFASPPGYYAELAQRGYEHRGLRDRSVLGFAAYDSTAGTDTYRAFAVPHWAAALAALLPPACRAAGAARRRGRGLAGLCPDCGYDLRATPGRCPECGRAGGDGKMLNAEC